MTNKSIPDSEALKITKHTIVDSEGQRREQRRQFNIDQLVQVRVQILHNDECMADLVEQLIHKDDGDKELRRRLLIALGEATISDDLRIRERALMVLSQAGEHAYFRDDNSSIFLVAHCLCNWLHQEKNVPAGLVVVLKRMEELTGWLLEKSFWREAEKIMVVLHNIASGQLEKGSAIKSLANHTLHRLACDTALEKLCDAYLLEDDQQPLYKNLLLWSGPRAIRYVLQRVHRSTNKKERLALLDLLPAYGPDFLRVAEALTKKELPWTMLRDIIFVLGEQEDDEGYRLVQCYVDHDDLRIQYEVVCSLAKIGGTQLNSRLLQALETVDVDLQPHVLQLLSERVGKDRHTLEVVLELLKRREFFPAETKDRIVCGAIAILKTYADPASVDMLRTLTEEYRRARGSLHLQLEEALHSLRPQLRHKLQHVKRKEEITFDEDPQTRQKALVNIKAIEEKLRTLLSKGDIDGASRHLADHAADAVQGKNFILAEKLRDRLLQINPMALNDVVALGDKIERAKNHRPSGPSPELWRDLFAGLTSVERKALSLLMRPEEVAKGQTVVTAGESDHVLYFLEAGQITLHCRSGGNENFLKRIAPGAILGAEQFFAPSVWTVTLRAATDVFMQVIDGSDFAEVAETHLILEQTLRNYCERFTNIPELLKMSGEERREFPRFAVPLLTRNILIDPFGNKGKRSFLGELLDISRNGLSFIIRISSRNSGKLLLGRRIQCDIEERGNLVMATCTGVIVGVRYRDTHAKDATIHVKLSEKLELEVFEKILSLR